jgi:hypothetical protein
MRRRDFIAGLGSAAVWPLAARARQQTKPTVIWFDVRPGLEPRENVEAFRRGLAQVGFSEGRDVTVEYHTADGHYERLPALASDLVRQRPAAIYDDIHLETLEFRNELGRAFATSIRPAILYRYGAASVWPSVETRA